MARASTGPAQAPTACITRQPTICIAVPESAQPTEPTSGALSQADYAVLGSVVGRPAWQPDEAAERGAVDDGATALRAHLAQLVLHAGPDTTQVDGVHAVEVLGQLV